MQLSDCNYKFGGTVVLAYPDVTRLAGYRAAVGLWIHLLTRGGSSNICTAKFDSVAAVEETVQALGAPELNSTSEFVVFGTPASLPQVTFCFVNGMPAAEHVPVLVDQIVGVLEAHGVERLVVPAAADIGGIRESDRLWAVHSTGSGLLQQQQQRLASMEIQPLPEGAYTNDVFLSTLDNIGSVSGIKDVCILVHGDKRPSGSGYRQTVTFGSEFIDESDASLVLYLGNALAAVAASGAVGEPPVRAELVTRTRLNADSIARALPAFG
ncbi:hypothetical protein H4R26_006119 [Coemansia thaxteri]|uniref:Uncharacterized protein n=1 Tax=Coemansia thaxteri TaxID=2663907 RepID=A0A9W8BEJ1_9FUNG|nr:hypothetical protein H4R26_006119 [Coemansia thaxteri]